MHDPYMIPLTSAEREMNRLSTDTRVNANDKVIGDISNPTQSSKLLFLDKHICCPILSLLLLLFLFCDRYLI